MTWQPDSFRSRRCDPCDVNWPRGTRFDQCPGCDCFTESSYERPLDAGPAADLVAFFAQERAAREARSKANHELFEQHLRERDEAIVRELTSALDLLPTAAEPVPRPGTTENFGLAGGELSA